MSTGTRTGSGSSLGCSADGSRPSTHHQLRSKPAVQAQGFTQAKQQAPDEKLRQLALRYVGLSGDGDGQPRGAAGPAAREVGEEGEWEEAFVSSSPSSFRRPLPGHAVSFCSLPWLRLRGVLLWEQRRRALPDRPPRLGPWPAERGALAPRRCSAKKTSFSRDGPRGDTARKAPVSVRGCASLLPPCLLSPLLLTLFGGDCQGSKSQRIGLRYLFVALGLLGTGLYITSKTVGVRKRVRQDFEGGGCITGT